MRLLICVVSLPKAMQWREDAPARPRGVKEGAFAAWVEKVAFLAVFCKFAGVKDGDSTLRILRDLQATPCQHSAGTLVGCRGPWCFSRRESRSQGADTRTRIAYGYNIHVGLSYCIPGLVLFVGEGAALILVSAMTVNSDVSTGRISVFCNMRQTSVTYQPVIQEPGAGRTCLGLLPSSYRVPLGLVKNRVDASNLTRRTAMLP